MDRRSALRALLAAPVVAVGSKIPATSGLVGKLTKLVAGESLLGSKGESAENQSASCSQLPGSWNNSTIHKLIGTLGETPQFIKNMARRDVSYNWNLGGQIDPDLESFKSFSKSAKRAIQIERDVNKRIRFWQEGEPNYESVMSKISELFRGE